MPFTFCHAAAVVPLARRLRLPLSALVVGSMSPDFMFYATLWPDSDIGHRLVDLLVFCLPSGLLVLWLWHAVMKKAAMDLLPAALRQRLTVPTAAPFTFWPGGRLLTVAGAIVLGACTHDVWDAFTHPDGWVVLQAPVLQASFQLPGLGAVPVYKLLQHLSTLVGGALLLWWFWQWLHTAPAASWPVVLARGPVLLVLLLPLAAGLGFGYARWQAGPPVGYMAVRNLLVVGLVTSITALWIELMLLGLYRLRKTKRVTPVEMAR
ncbi:DUF4184 family protein [Hymenobacter koreensis]|uniref:DUF4184 family protein n=1 Tax=Hymenobacter koreensis TaxID=1084523 RepID=A0ABP8J5U6_9BACT